MKEPMNNQSQPINDNLEPDVDLNVNSILEEIKNEMQNPSEKPDIPPGTVCLDEDVVLQMVIAVQDLTREVKQLRADLTGGVATVPAEKIGSEKKPKKKPKSKTASVLGNVAFYAVLVLLVVGAFLFKSHSSGAPFTFAGHAAFTVLTSSMEDTYPKGSLVVTKAVDANGLQIGDDITFMISESSSVTHRIVGIIEDYQGTGQRAFETQGTMNENPDKEPAIAANVVGKVIFCSVVLGQAAAFITKNWPMLLFFVVVIAGLVAFLKWNMKRPDHKAEKKRVQTLAPAEEEVPSEKEE